jgi:hypothetical protein
LLVKRPAAGGVAIAKDQVVNVANAPNELSISGRRGTDPFFQNLPSS